MSEATLELQPVETIIRVMLTTSRALDEYLDDLKRRKYSERTRSSYTYYLDKLCDRIPRDLDVSQIKLDDHLRPFLRSYNHCRPGTQSYIESVVASFFNWLYHAGKITRDPCDKLVRTRRPNPEDLDVTSVSADGVRLLMFHANTWAERLAIGVLAYLGPRRHAVAMLRITDYDRARGRIRFHEKGGKTIYKPIPAELDTLIEAAIAAGVYDGQDYLIPPEGHLTRKGDRDDRCIWRLVKKVASIDRAGIDAHVHALRAAFAVFYLEENPGDVAGLKELLGHKRISTTEIYLRKADKQAAMEPVRKLSWRVADPGSAPLPVSPQIAEKAYVEPRLVGAGGFEPPNQEPHLAKRDTPNEPRDES